ncbi:MAG: adenylyl-sulfate kinase [Bacteroidota bacterium]|jgi:adenylylsulfate kinase
MQKSIVWLMGLSGAGKSTIADALKELPPLQHLKIARIDGDELRSTLSNDLGFSTADRYENLRRAAHICPLLLKENDLVIASFITPEDQHRKVIQDVLKDYQLILVWVNCSLQICEMRDPKGLYKAARAGAIQNFTGVHQPFIDPVFADIILHTDHNTIQHSVQELYIGLKSFLNV